MYIEIIEAHTSESMANEVNAKLTQHFSLEGQLVVTSMGEGKFLYSQMMKSNTPPLNKDAYNAGRD